MAGLFISLFERGISGAILIVLGLVGLFAISASTFSLFSELFRELGKPLELESEEFYILIGVLAIALIILSELGPVCRVVGKAFIVFQFGAAVLGLLSLLENFDKYFLLLYIAFTLLALCVGLRMTEDFWEFLLEHPVLSVLSAIPASFFIFEYVWLMKEEFSKVNNMVILAKESLIITLIIFAVFSAIEFLIFLKNRRCY